MGDQNLQLVVGLMKQSIRNKISKANSAKTIHYTIFLALFRLIKWESRGEDAHIKHLY